MSVAAYLMEGKHMTIADWIGIAGGLALFLYGIRLMGDGIELLAGSKLKSILERLTRNRFVGLLVGLLVTAIIQSSNATTAMAVGFVNAGLMEFSRASGVILGANIGTTATGLLIALKISDVASIIAFIGVALIVFIKNKKANSAGMIIAGLGILFIGMNLMKQFMAPLAHEQWFTSLMLSLESKVLLAIIVGTLFTAVVQSVSASVGILQAMAMAGAVTSLDQVVYVILGMNIGCCIAAVTAAVGGSKDAKRTAMIHVLFNVFACVIFAVSWGVLPLGRWMRLLTEDTVNQIAYFNLIEKTVATIVMFPLLPLLEKLARLIIPGEDKISSAIPEFHINVSSYSSTSNAIAQVRAETAKMFSLAETNLKLACGVLIANKKDPATLAEIECNENRIDYLNRAITEALVEIMSAGITDNDARLINSMMHVVGDYERIGDHADNIAGYAKHIGEEGLSFSKTAVEQIRELSNKVIRFVGEAERYFLGESDHSMDEIEIMEEEVDYNVDELEEEHIRRMESGICTAQSGMLYAEVLTDLERVADHALNIAQAAKHK